MKNFVKPFCFLILAVFCCFAWAQSSPMPMLQSTSDEMIGALKANKATLKSNPQFVYGLVNRILLPHVDVTSMAHAVLGRQVWDNATQQQRDEFTRQFTTLLVHTYSAALAAYQDQEVKFLPIRGDVNGSRVQVNSQILQQGGPTISVSYRLVLHGDEWQVYDFSVDGVSMIQSFRSQFASELNQGNLDSLISRLSAHNSQS